MMIRTSLVVVISLLLFSFLPISVVAASAKPTVQFSLSSSSGNESTTPANLAVTLSAKINKAATVKYAVTGGTASGGGVDYTLAAGTLSIPANTLSVNISVPIVNDTLAELNETIIVTLSSPTQITLGTNKTHTYTILDNDPVGPKVSFNTATSYGSETLSISDLSVSLDTVSTQSVTVNWAVTSGGTATNLTDYSMLPSSAVSGTLTFAPGEMLKTIRVANVRDDTVEGDETVKLTLSNPANASLGSITTLTYTIYDSPPRNIAGDYWADVVLGQRDFTQSNSNQIQPNRAFNVGGVVVDRSPGAGTRGRIYVWDAGNNRILGFDLDKPGNCYDQPGCNSDIVIGQPSGWEDGACNQDSSASRHPYMSPASASTLCGSPAWRISQKEGASTSRMAVDPQTGDLYVPDYENHRVLIFNHPFTDSTPEIADDVIGQDDFSGVYCNKHPYARAVDGQMTVPSPAPVPSLHTPDSTSLCAFSETLSQGFGVALDAAGNLWVADGGNNRVLRFPKDSVTHKISKSANLVLGQTNFISRAGGVGLNQMQGPNSLAFGPDGKLYVGDGLGQENYTVNSNDRVLVFTPPLSNGMTGTLFSGGGNTWFKRAFITGVSGVAGTSGLWINSFIVGDIYRIKQYDWDGTLLTTLPKWTVGPNNFEGPVDVDKAGNVLLPGNRDVSDVLIYKPSDNYTTPTTLLSPTWSTFQDNVVTDRHLTNADGIATAQNQLYLSDTNRILIWNNLDQLVNGKKPDSFIGQPDPSSNDSYFHGGNWYGQMKTDANGRLWVASSNRIFVFQTPLYIWSKPIKVIEASVAAPISVLNSTTDKLTALGDGDGWGAFGFVPTADGNFLWISHSEKHRVLRIRNPLSDTPQVDVVLGQTDFSGATCNRDGIYPVSGSGSLNKLCKPWHLSIDRNGNLYVSDHRGEAQGNRRMLMFGALPTANAEVIYAPDASKEFPAPTNATYEPAFDSTNRMVVGYDPYVGGVSTFMGIYDNPLSTTTDPASQSNPTCTPPSAGEDCYLNDHMVYTYAVTFDADNNLYIGDPNRSKVFIYKRPFNNPTGIPPGPIYSAMDYISSHISASSDDAYTCGTTTITDNSGYNHRFNVVGRYASCPSGAADSIAGLRFTGLSGIPATATIDNAVIIYRPTNETVYTEPLKVKFNGVGSNSPETFSTSTPLTSLTMTTATVNHDDSGNGPWRYRYWHSSPNLKAIVQEIISQPGWQTGNHSMAFLISNDGMPNERSFINYDYDPTNAPYLYIQYH